MRYSNTTLRELKKRYRNILIKCALLNVALMAFAMPAGAEVMTPNTNGLDLRDGGSYTINENVSISNSTDGIIVLSPTDNKHEDGRYNGTQLTINANNVSISTSASGNYGALWTQTRSAYETLPEDASRIDITADTISIQAQNAKGIVAMSNSAITLKGNTVINAETALVTRGYSNISINEGDTSKTLQITGNISFDYSHSTSQSTIDSTINLTFNGTNSFWQGNVISNWDNRVDETKFNITNGLTITLNDGASWTATSVTEDLPPEQLAVTNMIVNKGTIHSEGGNAHIKNATINGDLTLNGTLTTVKGGTINFASGSTVTTTLDASTVKFAGDGEIAGTVNLTSLSAGEYAFVADAVTVDNLTFNNGLYNIDWTDDTKTNIKITEKSSEQVTEELASSTGATTEETTALLAMVSADGTGTEKGQLIASAISENMQSGNSAAAVDTAKKVAPTTSQMIVGIAKEAAKTMARVAGTRMDAISGRSGGDITEGAGLWMQALYNHTKQDSTSTTDGFKANSRGLAIGVDKKVTDTTTLGFGYGYMNTDADSYGRDVEVDGHNFFIYGKYQPSTWYVSSVLNYNYSKYTEKKTPLGISLRSEYDVNSYGIQLMTGYDMDNGLTPEMGLRYLDVDSDSYNDGMQRIRSNHDDVLTAVAGIKYTTNVKSDGVVFKPTARLAATYDVISDNSRANVSVIGGSNYAIDGKRLHRFGVEAGLGVTAQVDNIDITLEYNGAFRQDYKSQGGMLRARYNF